MISGTLINYGAKKLLENKRPLKWIVTIFSFSKA
jgi:hypothetical protein